MTQHSTSAPKQTLLNLSDAEGSIVLPRQVMHQALESVLPMSSLPDRSRYDTLRSHIANHYGLDPLNTFLGNGSDDLIENIARLYSRGPVLVVSPTFGRLSSVNTKVGLSQEDVKHFYLSPENDFEYDDATHQRLLANICTLEPSVLWLCTPNNPTGTLISPRYVVELSELMPEGKVVVDQVFLDFLGNAADYSCVELVKNQDNIIVINSFSKAKGLAGLRLGFGFGNKNCAQELSSMMLYYALSTPAVELGIETIRSAHQSIQVQLTKLRRNRETVLSTVGSIPNLHYVANSSTNLMCLKLLHSADIYDKLARQGVLTKDLSRTDGMENQGYVRVRIPSNHSDMVALIAAIEAAAAT
ncbi:histidinol-phosphate aminotransferase family protein [Patescibacteria group bacterium]|nr:MAG: histidinol-phosphate aminotransferase family protein [Patescibacteria group bacterium]